MLSIEYCDINAIKPYPGNAKKHPAEQIEQIKQSISDFGFNDPIAVWNGEIVEGHGRLIAAQELQLAKVPVIRLDGLTDEQRRAYTLIHNKLTMNSGFDKELLEIELANIPEIDMEQFGFEPLDIPDGGAIYGDERFRTDYAYNLDKLDDTELTEDFWEMPMIRKTDHIPEGLISFNYAKTSKDKSSGVHFYIDDYQFERIWTQPERYLDILRGYDCIISPDFSLYVDMPMPMKIWNTYRNRWLGAWYQSKGLTVIPNVRWDTEETYQFAFAGIEKDSVISVSTISLKTEFLDRFLSGMEECIKRLEPKAIILYGGEIKFDNHGVDVIQFSNSAIERIRGE